MTNKEIATAIKNGNVKFTIEGVTSYGMDESGHFGEILKVLEVDAQGESIWLADSLVFAGMNIDRVGPTTLRVYGFDLVGNKTSSVISFSRITILN